ncbi:MAG: RagB/SusD family nutrient uptake outer membrane protein [Bacteroidales bacterium]|nr:RagB/SusD family nutrient uptake outer membrane protein [Bacteroidales bacterium]
MKRYSFILPVVLLSVSLVSCQDDAFLEEHPKTLYTTTTAFEKSSQVESQLVTAYRKIFSMHGYSMESLASTPAILGGVGSDVFDIFHSLVGEGASGWSNYATWTANDSKFSTLWDDLYQLVSFGNLALQGSENVSWTDEKEKIYEEAQAHFFRGYAYLRLAECFGGVPIVDTFTETLRLDYERASREDTYKFAIEDLKIASENLPDYPKADGKVAKGAAYHFLAEAYLGLGVETGNQSGDCYKNAIAAASKTISLHPLMTKRFGSRANPGSTAVNNGIPAYKAEGNVYYDLFQIGNYAYSAGNTESVWIIDVPKYESMQNAGLSEGPYSQYMNNGSIYYLTSVTGPIFRDMRWKSELREDGANDCPFMGDIDLTKYPGGNLCAYLGGFSIGRVADTDYLANKVWSGDYASDMRNDPINICREFICLDRGHSRHGTVVKAEELIDPHGMYPLRAKLAMQDDWGWHTSAMDQHIAQYGRDWYVVRSAETYLLLAEAYLRDGNASDAAKALNAVRSRSEAKKLFSGSDVSIYTILDERARELAFEERRWPTLLRMGSSQNGGSNEVMVNQLKKNAMYLADFTYYTGDIAWTLFPIPTKYIQMNTEAEMSQNKGW